MRAFLFDTNVLNKLLDCGKSSWHFPKSITCYVTPVQRAELSETKKPERLAALLKYFEELQENLPLRRANLRSAPFGAAPFGESPFGGGDGEFYSVIIDHLNSIEGNKSKRGNTSDAMTLEACIYAHAEFVTNDHCLSAIAEKLGVSVVSYEQFSNDYLA